jgi:hypothetical protein
MKKLQLKALSLGAREILSREQLRSINGGCSNDDDCSAGGYCQNGSCWGNWGGSDIGGSGGGGGHSCPPLIGDACNIGNGPGNWTYPQMWSNAVGDCVNDPSRNISCS